MSEKMITLLGLIKTRLEGSTAFSGVTILTEDSNDIDTEINKALDGLGLFVLVGNPNIQNREPNGRAMPNLDVQVPIDIFENVTLNRDGESFKVCRDVAMNVIKRLAVWKPGSGYQYGRIQQAVPLVTPDHQIYKVTIEFQIGIEPLTE